MTNAAEHLEVPPWTLGWRLQRALDWGGVSVQTMAAELGVSRSTVSGWLNDRHPVRVIYLRHWAHRCRVPLEWLAEGELPRVDSNHQPAGWWRDLENVPEDRHLTRAEILAHQKRLRTDIRRGGISRQADLASAELSLCEPR